MQRVIDWVLMLSDLNGWCFDGSFLKPKWPDMDLQSEDLLRILGWRPNYWSTRKDGTNIFGASDYANVKFLISILKDFGIQPTMHNNNLRILMLHVRVPQILKVVRIRCSPKSIVTQHISAKPLNFFSTALTLYFCCRSSRRPGFPVLDARLHQTCGWFSLLLKQYASEHTAEPLKNIPLNYQVIWLLNFSNQSIINYQL